MIIIMEPQCIGWQHESANAGLIQLVSNAMPNEQIIFLAEKTHIECIKKIYEENSVQLNIKCCEIPLPKKIKDSVLQTGFYYKQIKDILLEHSNNITKFIMLSSHRGNITAIILAAKKYANVDFIVVLHGLLEQVINKSKRSKNTLISLRMLMNNVTESNISFITFSPCVKQELRYILNKNALNNMRFIHHPFVDENIQEINSHGKEGGKTKIALIGACANETTYRVLRDIDDKIKNKCIVETLVRNNLPFDELACVNVCGRGMDINRKIILNVLSRCDYVLIPYDKTEYRVMMSGILFDAIEVGVPILSLDNNPSVWYNQFGIGHVFSEVEDLKIGIVNLVQLSDEHEKERYVNNLKRLKAQIKAENKCFIADIIK